jgi:hypothetical protein
MSPCKKEGAQKPGYKESPSLLHDMRTKKITRAKGISLKNNFQSKDFQNFKEYNQNKYHYSRCCDIPGVPQVTRLNILWLYECHDYKDPHKPEDDKNLKINRLPQKHKE